MEFKEHLKKYLNEEDINSLTDSFDKKEHKGLILNPSKMSDEKFIKLFPNVKKHPIVPHAYLYDQDEYEMGKSIYHDLGSFYIQDPSASLVSYFLMPKECEQVLDMCAAPGGKSVQASMLMNQKGILYSNDLSFKRAEILLSNVERMGLGNVVVLSTDLSKIKGLENSFDAIILDAPCSGSGMFRKMSEMKDDWTYEKVIKASHIQKDLIMLAYSFLKEGGRLIYSTCSYSYEEDEEVVRYLLDNSDATLISLPDNEMFYRSDMKEAIHLFPNKFVGEGHFIALIKKPGQSNLEKSEPYHFTRKGMSKGDSKVVYHFELPNKPIEKLVNIALRPGLFTFSEFSNKKIVSHHYSHYLDSKDSYPLNDIELKKYLHGETITCNDNKNYSIVSYDGINVGAVNKTNNILKNLYPKGLRR
jgi:NOL1/NOP2/sun family putative RNA methylase